METITKIRRTVSQKLSEWWRVLKITRKPGREEYTNAAKITAAGVILIGLIGFLITSAANIIQMALRGGS